MPDHRVAVIDCGTNTVRLLIAEPGFGPQPVEVERRMEIVRLGQGVDATGRFHPDALARTFAAVERYRDLIMAAGVERTRFIATSATRDVTNAGEFSTGIEQRLGLLPEVITGEQEARLSFAGALLGAADPVPPVLVIDIGGGSTELITGDGTDIDRAVSLDIGSVRITERFWTADPPTDADLAAATAQIDRLLDELPLDWTAIRTWIGVAGTVTTLAALDLGLPHYDRARVHRHPIRTDDLISLCDRLGRLPVDRIRAIEVVHDKRADVIAAGALIAARIARRVPVPELIVSESDILDGAARELLDRR